MMAQGAAGFGFAVVLGITTRSIEVFLVAFIIFTVILCQNRA